MKPDSFQTFGELLVYLRKRNRLTQEELARAVGYSREQIVRLEKNQRVPDRAVVAATFIPALGLDVASELAQRLLELASGVHQPRTNLPAQLTSFIGREMDVAAVRGYLIAPDKRLVTLIGPLGIGKTRLSLQVAQSVLNDFTDGVFFVPLAAITDPAFVAQAISQSLGLVETDQRSAQARLTDGIGARQMLIVLDNFEQIIDAAPLTAELLHACPHLKIMVTSRESLRVPGEWLYPVPSLTIPIEAQLKTLTEQTSDQFSALQLFAERAQAVRPDFTLTPTNISTVAAICRQLDGLPLAIELIASRLRLMSPQALQTQLTSDFKLHADGMRGVPPRQKTLHNAIAWSYDLLSREEQSLLARLAVFAGGFTLEAAQAITQVPHALNRVMSLLDKSLLVKTIDAQGELRFSQLEMIHDFALDRLREKNEQTAMRDQHAAYFFDLARQAEAHWGNPDEARWTDRLEHESSNFHAALTWSFARGTLRETLLAVYQLWRLWTTRGRLIEGEQWCARLIAAYPEADAVKLHGLVLGIVLARLRNDLAHMRAYLDEARALAEVTGDNLKMVVLREAALYAGELGNDTQAIADLERAAQLYQQEQSSDLSEALYYLADIWMRQGELGKSKLLWEEGLARARQHGRAFYIGWGLSGLAQQSRYEGELEKAVDLSRESLAIKWQYQDRTGIAFSLEELAMIAVQQGNFDRAVILWSAAQHYRETIQSPLPHDWRVEGESHLARATAQLDTNRFTTLQSEGRALTVEQAIELALA